MNHQHPNLALHDENVPVFFDRPFQIVTLLDMLPFLASFFILATRELDLDICKIRIAIKENGKDTPSP